MEKTKLIKWQEYLDLILVELSKYDNTRNWLDYLKDVRNDYIIKSYQAGREPNDVAKEVFKSVDYSKTFFVKNHKISIINTFSENHVREFKLTALKMADDEIVLEGTFNLYERNVTTELRGIYYKIYKLFENGILGKII